MKNLKYGQTNITQASIHEEQQDFLIKKVATRVAGSVLEKEEKEEEEGE